MVKAQMRIQQMAFMLVAVVLFFVLVGLFVIGYQSKNLVNTANELQKDQAIASLRTIADMPELKCDGNKNLCLDSDKLEILARNPGVYADIWPVASIRVIRIFPFSRDLIKCPAANCSDYEVYDSGQKDIKQYATYVLICQKYKQYDKCDIGKLLVGVKLANG